MPIALWREEYATGNPKIDQEHQQLFSLINALHDAMMSGTAKHVLKKILDELIQYTVTHFNEEEAFMQSQGYPDSLRHHKIHEDLKKKVLDISGNFERDSSVVSIELSHFLTLWIIHHIRGEDQKMIKFMKQKLNMGNKNLALSIQS